MAGQDESVDLARPASTALKFVSGRWFNSYNGEVCNFSAPPLKPLILAYFRASEEWLTILFVKKYEKALIYKGFRAPATWHMTLTTVELGM